MKIKKGDLVKVIRGIYKDKSGRVEKILTDRHQAIVTGLNVRRRHLKGSSGGTTEVIRGLPVSNLVFICPKCQKPSRLGYRLVASGKVRFCKKCQSILEK